MSLISECKTNFILDLRKRTIVRKNKTGRSREILEKEEIDAGDQQVSIKIIFIGSIGIKARKHC